MTGARVCTLTGQHFITSNAEAEFCQKNGIPLPTRRPFERLRNLLAFRNRVYLTNGFCALTGEKMFTCIPPVKNFTVYDVEAWESDRWDALQLGGEYDFERPFFEQFRELLLRTPIPNLAVIRSTMENSDYTNGVTGAKNCYLSFAMSYAEDCRFSFCVNHSRDMVDCVNANHCELCFDCKNVTKCYNVKYSSQCHNCSDSAFLFGCQSCRSCFGCVNLSNKDYHFFNEPLSKEDYGQRLAAIQFGSFQAVSQLKTQFDEYAAQFPLKYQWGKFNELSSGNSLSETRRCTSSYFVSQSEDLEYCVWLIQAKSSFFYCCYGNGSELIYNSLSCGDKAYNLKFCFECWPGAKDLEYCAYTGYGSANCFGCVGLKRKSYCVFNRQYSKTEYSDLVKRIKAQMTANGEYGQFFPPQLSPFFYNKSDAAFFLPAARETVTKLGYDWEEEEAPANRAAPVLPDHIRDVPDSILDQTLVCEQSGRSYKIVRHELDFYRRHQIPLPRLAPLVRIAKRGVALELQPLHPARCGSCGLELETAQDQSREVYCEDCYQRACA